MTNLKEIGFKRVKGGAVIRVGNRDKAKKERNLHCK